MKIRTTCVQDFFRKIKKGGRLPPTTPPVRSALLDLGGLGLGLGLVRRLQRLQQLGCDRLGLLQRFDRVDLLQGRVGVGQRDLGRLQLGRDLLGLVVGRLRRPPPTNRRHRPADALVVLPIGPRAQDLGQQDPPLLHVGLVGLRRLLRRPDPIAVDVLQRTVTAVAVTHRVQRRPAQTQPLPQVPHLDRVQDRVGQIGHVRTHDQHGRLLAGLVLDLGLGRSRRDRLQLLDLGLVLDLTRRQLGHGLDRSRLDDLDLGRLDLGDLGGGGGGVDAHFDHPFIDLSIWPFGLFLPRTIIIPYHRGVAQHIAQDSLNLLDLVASWAFRTRT